jgi:hypothetical protein
LNRQPADDVGATQGDLSNDPGIERASQIGMMKARTYLRAMIIAGIKGISLSQAEIAS